GHAQWPWGRKSRLDRHVPADAADLRILPGCGVAALASNRGVVAAADLCVRRHARTADRPSISGRSHGPGLFYEYCPFRGRSNWFHPVAEGSATSRIADADWGVTPPPPSLGPRASCPPRSCLGLVRGETPTATGREVGSRKLLYCNKCDHSPYAAMQQARGIKYGDR